MQRCPCCNARLRGAAVCPRCQTDLRAGIAAGQAARWWLVRAIDDWQAGRQEEALHALQRSLRLKKTPLAVHFRNFLIAKCRDELLGLLAQKELYLAKRLLYRCRSLLPLSDQLRQLHTFTDYLLVEQGFGTGTRCQAMSQE